MAGFYTDFSTISVSPIRASHHAHIWRCYRYF